MPTRSLPVSPMASRRSSMVVPQSPPYPHLSSFRSVVMEIRIYSRSVKLLPYPGTDLKRSLPIFGDDDDVSGYVILDPSYSYPGGRLSVSIEGALIHDSHTPGHSPNGSPCSAEFPGICKHVFFSSSTSMAVSPLSEATPLNFRDSFIRRRPSLPVLQESAARLVPFRFCIPRGTRPGEEMPATFPSTQLPVNWKFNHVPSTPAGVEIAYTVRATWEAHDGLENRSVLDAPVLFLPESDFQSLDALTREPDCWLEMPLGSDRPLPFQCAVTMPNPIAILRTGTLPYFVVFTTTPRSPTLGREIASDATISISLIRQVVISESPSSPMSRSSSPSSDDNSSSSPFTRQRRRLRRIAKLSNALREGSSSPPSLPIFTVFSESRSLLTDMHLGFPKRPRMHCRSDSHPSLKEYASLPDGLFKGKIQLTDDVLPCIDWGGVRVKYYLDVSVLVGQDEVRARVPVQVY